jgi:O-antigen ligase
MLAHHPIGVGLLRFKRHIGEYSPHKGYDAHNFYVLMLCEAGPQGLIAWLYLMWHLFGLTKWMRQNAPKDDPEAQALAIGFSVSTVCMCFGGLYGSPLLREGAIMAPYWAMAGLLERYFTLKLQTRGVAAEPRVVDAALVERFPLAVHLPQGRSSQQS